MKNKLWLSFCLCMLAVGLTAPLSAGIITVDSTSNIWGAGHAAAPGGGGLPPVISFSLGSASWVRINSATGTVDCSSSSSAPYCVPVGADGGANIAPLTGTNFSATGGLSGIRYDGRSMFMIGVFLDGSEPSGSAPTTLVYNDSSAATLTVSPLLSQLFFIGDGFGTGGANQQFMIPTGATRLFLGFADGDPFQGSPSTPTTPGGYADNLGALTVDYTLMSSEEVPEPGSALLVGLGIAALALGRRKRRA